MRQLGELEAVVMRWMWSHQGPVSVRDVLEDLSRERKIAYTTVMTVMDKLHRKGWLRRERVGRAYRYEPVQTRDAYSAQLMREALAASTDRTVALVHFVDAMSSAEVAALRAALEVARGQAAR